MDEQKENISQLEMKTGESAVRMDTLQTDLNVTKEGLYHVQEDAETTNKRLDIVVDTVEDTVQKVDDIDHKVNKLDKQFGILDNFNMSSSYLINAKYYSENSKIRLHN